MWSGKVTGDLYVREEHDDELHRTVKIARLVQGDGSMKDLLNPLIDAVLVTAKPDWYTMTGWERCVDVSSVTSRAFQQSWILIPVDAR